MDCMRRPPSGGLLIGGLMLNDKKLKKFAEEFDKKLSQKRINIASSPVFLSTIYVAVCVGILIPKNLIKLDMDNCIKKIQSEKFGPGSIGMYNPEIDWETATNKDELKFREELAGSFIKSASPEEFFFLRSVTALAIVNTKRNAVNEILATLSKQPERNETNDTLH